MSILKLLIQKKQIMKTRMIITAILALITMTLFTSCEKIKGKGEVITETRTTGNFSGISLAMTATVYFTPGASWSLQISGQENVLKQIVTQVEGTHLSIRVRNGVILGSHESITVYVTAPSVTDLNVSGSGDIFVDKPWSTTSLSVNISGSGTVSVNDLTAEQLSAVISGSGTIRATSGKVTREDLNISGSGTVDLRSVECQTVYSTTSGSGDTYVHATSMLDVTISGSGDIWYYGTPVINTHISGSGNLKRM
jgi:hypothetical protein